VAFRLIELCSVLELERCPLLRTAAPDDPEAVDREDPRCWASDEPRAVEPATRQARCLSIAHTVCPALLKRLEVSDAGVWLAVVRAARIVTESCRLAQARLEVQAEQLGPTLAQLFGSDP
jgi:hypothetical protein